MLTPEEFLRIFIGKLNNNIILMKFTKFYILNNSQNTKGN